MGVATGIEWTDHTFNPWIGCTALSPACDHCYATALVNGRMGGDFDTRRRTSAENWKQPRRWNRAAATAGVRRRVFCASLADVFDNQVPTIWREDLFELIRETPSLIWQLLTKRPQNIAKMLPPDWRAGYPNVWLGTTVENQKEASRRIPHLLAVPAPLRFLSCEPLLGPVCLTAVDVNGHSETNALCPSTWQEVWDGDWSPETTGEPLDDCIRAFVEEGGVYPPTDIRPSGIGWVIVGGESGPGARPMHPQWVRSLQDQCAAAAVPFFFKQWGDWAPHRPQPGGDVGGDVRAKRVCIVHPTGETETDAFNRTGRNTVPGSVYVAKLGKKASGNLLDGVQHQAWPA